MAELSARWHPVRLRLAIFFALLALMISSCAAELADGDEARSCSADPIYTGPAPKVAFDRSAFPVQPANLERPLAAETIRRLDAAFAKGFAASRATAASVAIARLPEDGVNAGIWTARVRTDGGPRDFWWASAGKMVTASVILQLVGEGRLSLDATIESWFPEFPHAVLITIDQLLTHTSGAFTFDNDARQRTNAGYVEPNHLVEMSARQGLDFCPGTDWSYSNTGYVMLALIAERIERRPFAEIVRRRIAEPLNAPSLRVLAPDADPGRVVAPRGKPGGTIAAFATIGGAGPVVGEPIDMLRALDAWLHGALIPASLRDGAVARLFPVFSSSASYGQGIMVIDVPDAFAPTRWIGHLGGSPDSKAVLIYDVHRRTFIALVLNTDANGETLALNLLKAL